MRNIFMGRELTNRLGVLDVKTMRSETQKLMNEVMGFTSSAITPESTVKHFSGGERQGVAITRALYFQAELIILDEPTMACRFRKPRRRWSLCEYQEARQSRDLYRSQHLPRVSGGRSNCGGRSGHDCRAVLEIRSHDGRAARSALPCGADGQPDKRRAGEWQGVTR